MTDTAVTSNESIEKQVSAAIIRCAGGDRAALRTIYDLEAARMIGVALRILRRRDLAEEAAHDAFVRVWNGARGFDPALGSGRTWLFAIVRNRALSILRDEGRLVSDADPADDVPAPDAAVSCLAEASALRRCLLQLDARRREVVVLAYVHGLSHGELAGRMGIPLGTAKSWIRRSLASLKECLG